MKKILSVLLTLIFVFLCACSAQGTQERQLSAHIDGLIEETTIEWKDDNTAVVSFDKHAVNNVVVMFKIYWYSVYYVEKSSIVTAKDI